MFKKFAIDTLNLELSCKSIPCGIQVPNLKSILTNQFLRTWNLYQKLFEIIKDESSFYKKPQPLRHPLIFYYGHTAVFFINKLMCKGVIKQPINDVFQRILAVGVDEMDWDDMDQTHYQWPTLSSIRSYRQKVKKLILKIIQDSQQKIITYKSNLWIILMGIQHQKLHLQTSAVIIRRLPVQDIRKPLWCNQCPFVQNNLQKIPINQFNKVPKTFIQWKKSMQNADYYGWDSQFGYKKNQTQQFQASIMLVSNGQFYQFFKQGGYKKQLFWTDQGKKWLNSSQVQMPIFWVIQKENNQKQIKKKSIINNQEFYLKTLTRLIKMPWNWPVEVNNHQASAFCKWKSIKQNKQIRLPSEDEYFSLRNLLKTDYYQWANQSVGNINLQFWLSPCPVNLFQVSNFFDIVGNVYQHTETYFYPFQNFTIHPQYEDFSTPSFDEKHIIMKGGSFISTGNSASLHYRVSFRKHFYQFAGFRYVKSKNKTTIICSELNQSDQSVKKALTTQFINKNSYIQKILSFLKSIDLNKINRSLVIGCSVGRLPLQLSKIFEKSYGTDYNARYFQMATKLLQKGFIKYQNIQIALNNLQLNKDTKQKVKIYQMNPLNIDQKKINNLEQILKYVFY